jgi:hypothetical protein
MATIHISEADAARDFAGLLARVRAGFEIVIDDASPAIVVRVADSRPGRLLSESIASSEARGFLGTLDGEFGRDLSDVIECRREPLSPPEWD